MPDCLSADESTEERGDNPKLLPNTRGPQPLQSHHICEITLSLLASTENTHMLMIFVELGTALFFASSSLLGEYFGLEYVIS